MPEPEGYWTEFRFLRARIHAALRESCARPGECCLRPCVRIDAQAPLERQRELQSRARRSEIAPRFCTALQKGSSSEYGFRLAGGPKRRGYGPDSLRPQARTDERAQSFGKFRPR